MSKYNYFEVISISDTFFSLSQSVAFGFIPVGFSLLNRGDRIVEYSFDGTTLHGDLNPGDASAYMVFKNRSESRVWLRVPSGVTANIRIEAWGGWGRKL